MVSSIMMFKIILLINIKKIILQMNIQLPLNLDKLQLETKQELEELIYILRMLKTILLIFGK